MQPEMLFLRELADGVTEHRINLMMQGAEGVDDNVGVVIRGDISGGEQTFKSIGKKNDMLFEVTFMRRVKVVMADNRQNRREGG